MQIDPAALDGAADGGDDGVPVEAAEGGNLANGRCRGRISPLGAGERRGRQDLGDGMQGAPIVVTRTRQHDIVPRDQVGKLFDQPRKLLDLAG
ncbi:MAG: hypothetical protein ABSA90_07135 [Xanthobacteraceae bacterium]